MAPSILDSLLNYIEWFYKTKIHFLQLHYLYILFIALSTSTFFYYQPGTRWDYIDALFMATSAATNTGLNTITMSHLSTWQLLAVYFSSFLGSHIVISMIILYVRKHYFSKRFEDILIFNKAQRLGEENKRKFEKNIQEQEKQRRRSLGSFEKVKQYPLRRRLSFMSARSSQKDEEHNQTSAVPNHNPRKKNRSHSLSAGFNHFDLLSHFRRKSHNHEEEEEEDGQFEQRTCQLPRTECIEFNDDSNMTAVSIISSSNSKDTKEETCSMIENVNNNNVYRGNSEASLPHTIRPNDNTLTIPLIYQNGNKNTSNNTNNESGFNNSNNISLCLTNTTETILSNSSSHNLNSNSNDNNNNNNTLHPIVHFATTITKSNEDLVCNTSEDTTVEDNNNTLSGNQGIAFAENIERQREIARRRLEQDRKFDDILQRIAGDSDSTHIHFDQGVMMEAESDDEEMKRIMREPIHKSELTRQQRYRLGGAEYRAIVFLTRLIPVYYLCCSLGFGFIIRIYIASSSYAQNVLMTTNETGPLNVWLFSFFTSMSSFNNLGLTQIDASMVPFQSSPGFLIPVMFLILAGNTAYAIFLRLIIWVLYKCTPKSYVMRKETFRYLLDHPRRCYTTLFPSTQTKWLLIVLIGITAAEFVGFVALNFWLPVLDGIDWADRILDGLFQSIATRNAGYSIVDLMALNPGTQIVFIVAMYISVYPVAISMRNSNVYQERALGIYHGQGDDEDENEYEHESDAPNFIHRLKRSATISSVVTTSKKVLRKPDFFVMTQIQRQLTSEICWVICCIFAICVIEAEEILAITPITIASVIYECVSAFGNVGATVGYPALNASQAQKYHPMSKLVLIILMYRGRHRGLPAAIDRAVLLPSEQLEAKEQEDHLLRRRNTSLSIGDGHAVMFYNRSRTL
ncbi:hypothetical protein MFLAVUS_008215 [Mucor flavus]|uniref:Potassium transport protein n=1 Tax=Mucor flavus TaxID=439312 RepID=A0ABP9Z6G6_9FUNG